MLILRRIFLFLDLRCFTAMTDHSVISPLTGLIKCHWQTSEFV